MNLENYLKNIIVEFEKMKSLAERAMAQVSDSQFFELIDTEANSIAVIVKHIVGNQHSRWSDFLNSDGEKENRHRDNEFLIIESDSRESLMVYWESGWKVLIDTLQSLSPDDLDKVIKIRNENHFVFEAINRQLTHYSYHIGEVVLLAKHLSGENWMTLSIAKGESDKFNKTKFEK